MQTNNQNKIVVSAAFVLMIAIFYFYDNYMVIGGFGVGYQYICCAMVVLLGFGWFLIEPDPMYLGRSVKMSLIIALPYVVIMLCTAGNGKSIPKEAISSIISCATKKGACS